MEPFFSFFFFSSVQTFLTEEKPSRPPFIFNIDLINGKKVVWLNEIIFIFNPDDSIKKSIMKIWNLFSKKKSPNKKQTKKKQTKKPHYYYLVSL